MIKNKLFTSLNWLNKHKMALIAMIALIIAIALPGAFSFANETDANQAAAKNTPNAITISGTVTDLNGGEISTANKPYVQIAGGYIESLLPPKIGFYEDMVDVNADGTYTINNVEPLMLGVITAGANGYANEILSIAQLETSKTINFELDTGAPCTFVNEEEKLDTYCLCLGSTVTTKDGLSVALSDFFDEDIELGAGLPQFGAPVGATLTENKAAGTLTYYYKNPTPGSSEEYKLIFKAKGEPGFDFKKWSINGADVPTSSYVVKANEAVTIAPVWESEEPMPPLSAIIYEADGETPINGAYAYVVGYQVEADTLYLSDIAYTKEDGRFTIADVPEDVEGLLVVGAAKHVNRFQYIDKDTPATEFHLEEGMQIALEVPDGVGNVVIQKGSYIDFSAPLKYHYELKENWDFGNLFLPFGMSPEGTITLSKDGAINYHLEKSTNAVEIKDVDVNIKVSPEKGYVFKKWLFNGKEFEGAIDLTKVGTDVTITPVFERDVPPGPTPMTVSAHLYDHETEAPITNGYAYIVGVRQLTEEPYISEDYAITDSTGLFTFKDVPEDIYGVLIVGAPGYVNRGQLLSIDNPATDFYLNKGIQCNLDISDAVNTIMIEKGSNVTLQVPGIGTTTIPLDFDVDFGNVFLPFGMTPKGSFNFMDDARLSYSFTKNAVDILGVEINIKVVPKEGYIFKGWLKDGEPISGEYQLSEGEKDLTITPYFEAASPTPTPDDPTHGAQTFDSLSDLLIAFVIFASAFSIVFAIKYARRKREI